MNGDTLTREEFERRWAHHPEIKRAERIDGIVWIEVSVSTGHAASHISVAAWVAVYASRHGGLQALDNATVRIDADDLQPDVALRRTEEAGGSTRIVDTVLEGAPEFVFEVAATSASYDLNQKLRAYERGGVSEYVVWQLYEERIDWFELRDGHYVRREPGPDGTIESAQFPGLRLDVAKMLSGDMAGVLSALG
jgi:Uma2 family endonuclease